MKLTDILLEVLLEKKLCPKGKAYYNRRIAAGEKPSAYLSGRAVKVCKGLMEEDDLDMHESLRDWFEKEDWVRIDTQGNITGPCGTMKKGKATTRCLPRAKANNLTKAERAATARKKVAGSKKGKQFVPNTEKAKVRLEYINEIIDPSEAYNDTDAVQTLIDGKRNLAFVVEKSNNKDNWARIQKMIADNGLKAMYVKGNTNNAYVVYTPGSEAKANELKDIAETYDGYLSANATKEDTIKIGELLGYNHDKIMAYVAKNFPDNVDEARVTPVGISTPFERNGECIKQLRNKTNKPISKLNFKIGKYNVTGDEYGVKMTWNEGNQFLSAITKRNAENLFTRLNIQPEEVYIGVVPTRCAYSYYIIGNYNGNPIAIARKEASSPMSGQTYLTTPNVKKQLNKFGTEDFPEDSLEEARVTPMGMGRILPKEDIKILSNLVDTFGEGNSGFELYEPLSQGYRIEDYCDDENEDSSCAAIKHLLSKYPKGAKFVSNELFGYNNFAPGVSPNGKFTELIEIEPSDGTIWISAPYISGDFNGDNYNAGWFDGSGNYQADTKNIDEEGNYIGGNA